MLKLIIIIIIIKNDYNHDILASNWSHKDTESDLDLDLRTSTSSSCPVNLSSTKPFLLLLCLSLQQSSFVFVFFPAFSLPAAASCSTCNFRFNCELFLVNVE
jgi:hypothetical protein